MERSNKRSLQPRWRRLGGTALAMAAVAMIGFATVTPAKADWRRDDWGRHHDGVGFGFSVGAPAYGYYPYPAYPAYGYPYYYGGYPYYYGGPSVSLSFGHR